MLRIAAVASLMAIWFVCRYYVGIQHDARLYVGRALADLHPDTIGQEFTFVYDGQSAFSLFPALVRALVVPLGTSNAAMLLTFLALAVWLAAAAALLSRFTRGPILWVSLVALAALPSSYGGYSIFKIAEPFATPRILAEAAGLLALAALLGGRKVSFFVLLGVGVVLHPIMALPVAVIGFVLLIVEDRRWIVPPMLGLAGMFLAILLHAPIALRLTEHFDSVWWGILGARNLLLFPNRWLAPDWAVLVQQLAALGVLCRLCKPPLQTIVLAAIAATLIGIVLPILFPSVLIIQAQPWRAQWVLAFLAPATLPLTISRLYERGGGWRALIPLVLLITVADGNLKITLFVAALVHLCLLDPSRLPSLSIVEKILWAVWGVATCGKTAILVAANRLAFQGVPLVAHEALHKLIATLLAEMGAPLLIILIVYGQASRFRLPTFVVALTSVIAATWSLYSWDSRSSYTRYLESGSGAESLQKMLPNGTVLWLGDTAINWFWTGRPEWLSDYSGSGMVFDRDLAIESRKRRDSLADAGIVDRNFTVDPRLRRKKSPRFVSASSLNKLCQSRTAPDWVVAPIGRVDGGILPSTLPKTMSIWRSPAPRAIFLRDEKKWETVSAFAVMPCSKPLNPKFSPPDT